MFIRNGMSSRLAMTLAAPHVVQACRAEAAKALCNREIPQHGRKSELRRVTRHTRECHRLRGDMSGIETRQLRLLQLRHILLHPRIHPPRTASVASFAG